MSQNLKWKKADLAAFRARGGSAGETPPPFAALSPKVTPPEVWPKMNKTEAEFYRKLQATTPPYLHIGCQSLTLRFAKRLSYTPDFITTDSEKNLVAWEVKGSYIYEDALVKLKVAPKLFPWIKFIMAQKKNGAWTTRQICP